MKNISYFDAPKYLTHRDYTFVEEGIYKFANKPDAYENGRYIYGNMSSIRPEPEYYVTSLCFEQEPDLGEGSIPGEISQYPLEDVLEKYNLFIQDFYKDLNATSTTLCYLEFAAFDREDIINLRGIIGKHVYNRLYKGDDGREYVKLVIEAAGS